MGDKKQVTMMSLSIILEGEHSKEEIEKYFIPKMRWGLSRHAGPAHYYPEIWIDSHEIKEMEIIPKK